MESPNLRSKLLSTARQHSRCVQCPFANPLTPCRFQRVIQFRQRLMAFTTFQTDPNLPNPRMWTTRALLPPMHDFANIREGCSLAPHSAQLSTQIHAHHTIHGPSQACVCASARVKRNAKCPCGRVRRLHIRATTRPPLQLFHMALAEVAANRGYGHHLPNSHWIGHALWHETATRALPLC